MISSTILFKIIIMLINYSVLFVWTSGWKKQTLSRWKVAILVLVLIQLFVTLLIFSKGYSDATDTKLPNFSYNSSLNIVPIVTALLLTSSTIKFNEEFLIVILVYPLAFIELFFSQSLLNTILYSELLSSLTYVLVLSQSIENSNDSNKNRSMLWVLLSLLSSAFGAVFLILYVNHYNQFFQSSLSSGGLGSMSAVVLSIVWVKTGLPFLTSWLPQTYNLLKPLPLTIMLISYFPNSSVFIFNVINQTGFTGSFYSLITLITILLSLFIFVPSVLTKQTNINKMLAMSSIFSYFLVTLLSVV